MRHFPIPVWIAVLATGSWHNPATAQTSWRGLVVAPESRPVPKLGQPRHPQAPAYGPWPGRKHRR